MIIYAMRTEGEWKYDTVEVRDAKLSRFLERHSETKYYALAMNWYGRDIGYFKIPVGFTARDVYQMIDQVKKAEEIVKEEGLKAPKLFGAARKAWEKKTEETKMVETLRKNLRLREDKPVVFNGLVFKIES